MMSSNRVHVCVGHIEKKYIGTLFYTGMQCNTKKYNTKKIIIIEVEWSRHNMYIVLVLLKKNKKYLAYSIKLPSLIKFLTF